ncbi:MAG: STAS domain-containing protein [Clostridiales bacterium]|jgi:uncharacterized protein (TIGR02172 family)|nr:STAS domain-containing protein [Clostridiales bacterium]
MEHRTADDRFIIELSGRIDSGNSADVEREINEALESKGDLKLVLDAQELEYISSAGLRVLLHLRKQHPELKIINVSTEVYDIFDMTGFNQMIDIEKAYKVVDITGCEQIGRGANGAVYRIDGDNVVKVYNDPNAFDEIQNEREVARLALVLGVPTAISYDIVRVGDGYGSVFEMLDASSFAKILTEQPDKFEWCLDEFTDMLRIIHSTEVPDGKLPDIRELMNKRAGIVAGVLPEDKGAKLIKLFEAIPYDNHMIHGDYHSKNLELTGDEVLLIDMDTLSVGDPIFELGFIYNAFVGFYDTDHDAVKEFQGYDYDTSIRFWKEFLPKYLGTDDETRIREVEDRARIVGYTRLIGRLISRDIVDANKADFDFWTNAINELLERTDSLCLNGK